MSQTVPRHLADEPRRHRYMSPMLAVIELCLGVLMLGAAAVAGLLFVSRPWENRLDVAAYNLIPEHLSSRAYLDAADLGSTKVFVAAVVVLAALSLFRDRVRSIACLVGPGTAVFVTERIAKPLVARHGVLGGDSYPSGTVTAVTALAVVLVLVAPRLAKPIAVLIGLGAVFVVSVAVIGLRWHYATDVLGGVLVGAGAVYAVDAAMHLPVIAWQRLGQRRDGGGSRPSARSRSTPRLYERLSA